ATKIGAADVPVPATTLLGRSTQAAFAAWQDPSSVAWVGFARRRQRQATLRAGSRRRPADVASRPPRLFSGGIPGRRFRGTDPGRRGTGDGPQSFVDRGATVVG